MQPVPACDLVLPALRAPCQQLAAQRGGLVPHHPPLRVVDPGVGSVPWAVRHRLARSEPWDELEGCAAVRVRERLEGS